MKTNELNFEKIQNENNEEKSNLEQNQLLLSEKNKSDDEQQDDEQNTSSRRRRRKTTIPKSEIELITVADDVVKNWDEKDLKILWITKNEFMQKVDAYKNAVNISINYRVTRSPEVNELSKIDKKFNEHLAKVRSAIITKFGYANRTAYYSEFGFVRNRYTYSLPTNRDQRIKSIEMLIEAIEKYNIELYDFGKEFWQNELNSYKELYYKVRDKSGDISSTIIEKNNLKETILKVLNAIINGLKMNYPDDYQLVMRKWGFQKDRY